MIAESEATAMIESVFTIIFVAIFMFILFLTNRNRLGSCSSCYTHCKLKELHEKQGLSKDKAVGQF